MVSILLLIDLLKLRGRLGKAQMETIRLSTLTNLRHPNRWQNKQKSELTSHIYWKEIRTEHWNKNKHQGLIFWKKHSSSCKLLTLCWTSRTCHRHSCKVSALETTTGAILAMVALSSQAGPSCRTSGKCVACISCLSTSHFSITQQRFMSDCTSHHSHWKSWGFPPMPVARLAKPCWCK